MNLVYLYLTKITNNIDKESTSKIISLLRELKNEKLVFISSHNDDILVECDDVLSLDY